MIAKILGAVWPLIIFPLILYLNLEGYLDFGAGEKDIVLAIPMLVFTLLYLIPFIILTKRKSKTYVAVITSSLIAFFLLMLLTLLLANILGVRG